MGWFSGSCADLPERLIIFSILTAIAFVWIISFTYPRATDVGMTLCKRGGDDGPVEVCSWVYENETSNWSFIKDDDMWPIHHYVTPIILGLFFCSYVFKAFENTDPYPFKKYKSARRWPVGNVYPYIYYFLMVAGLGAIWETWEASMALAGLGYFMEPVGDTNVGDMGLNYFGSVFHCAVFYLFLNRPVSYLFPYRRLWEKIERILWTLFVCVAVDYIAVVDIVIDDKYIIHGGYWLYIFLKLTSMEWARWSDMRIARREKWSVLRRDEVNLFYDYLQVFLIFTWLPSFGLQYSK